MGKIFGGYTDIPWKERGGYEKGNGNSFLFSLRDDFNFVKLRCLNKDKEVCHHPYILGSFGGGCGFTLFDDCNININSLSNLGAWDYYELPNGIKVDSDECQSYLAGSRNFKVLEIEVYKLE